MASSPSIPDPRAQADPHQPDPPTTTDPRQPDPPAEAETAPAERRGDDHEEQVDVDEQGRESFPASDPPANY